MSDPVSRESNIDDVLQISNIFVNVSKGEVAKADDLKKAFGIRETKDIVKEVRRFIFNFALLMPFVNNPIRSYRKVKCKWARENESTTSHP